MKKAVILARVSTPEQAKHGLSIEEIQLPKLRDYAKDHGMVIDKEFCFQETASQKLRKQFDAMIKYVKDNPEIKAIIGYRVDRLTRNFRDAVAMDNLRINYDKELHFLYDKLVLTKESFGKDIDNWDDAVHDAKKHINRCQAYALETIQSKLLTGQIYGKAPYGYKNFTPEEVNGRKPKKTVVLVPYEAGIVKKIFDLYTNGANSYLQISAKLKTEDKLKMHKSNVEKIIKNPFYMGKMLIKGQLYDHIYDTIISQEVYEIATDIRNGRNRLKKKGKLISKHGMYSGLVYCEECGCSFTATPRRKVQKNGNVHNWIYYYCTNAKRQHKERPEGIEEKKLTEMFAEIYKKMNIPDPELQWMKERMKARHEGKVLFQKEMFDTYTLEIKKRDTRIENAYLDKLDGRITQEVYDDLRSRFQSEKDQYLAKLNRLDRANVEYYTEAELSLDLASRSYTIFTGSEADEKRQIIGLTLQNLKMKDGKLVYEWQKPFDKIFKSAESLTWGPS